jgi:glycosyltransferase involved in cell wall biosynthesis
MAGTATAVCWKAVRLNSSLYHFHDPELIPAGLLLRMLGKKVIYDVHEDVPRHILSKAYLPRWQRRPLACLAELVESIACGYFSGLITVTPTIAERLRRYQPKTILVRNFPRLEEFPPSSRPWSERPPAVAFVGGIRAERGIREMVHAIGLVPSSLNPRLLLARDKFPKELHDEVATDPGWSRTDDRGSLGRPEIAGLLREARAGLLLFHPQPNNLPSMPHKLFEYMAAGIPVIASDFPVWREIVHKHRCGLLVDPLDPAAIARAIEFILKQPAEAEQMGLNGRLAAELSYSWQNEEQTLFRLYDSLLRNEASSIRQCRMFPEQRHPIDH